jgi:hypothetical protein
MRKPAFLLATALSLGAALWLCDGTGEGGANKSGMLYALVP